MNRVVRFAGVLLVLASPFTAGQKAFACPRCQLGIDVRQAVFADHFGVQLTYALAPFAVVLAMTLFYVFAARRHDPDERGSRVPSQ